MTNILIFGGNGMAGHMIREHLKQSGYNVLYTTRQEGLILDKHYYYDVTSSPDLCGIIEKARPDYIINATGVLNTMAEDNKATAVSVNSLFPHILDEKSSVYDYKLIHISTDCVFSGYKGEYIETSITDATTFYGRSKALGEINNSNNITIRTSIIGPEVRNNRIGLLNWFLNQRGEVRGYTNAIWTGVTTLQLSKSIIEIIDKDICGLIHLVNGGKISKYELLLLFKKYFKSDVRIIPYEDFICDKSLVKTREDYNIDVPDYETMIKELAEWMEKYKYN